MPRMSEMLSVIKNFKKYIDETCDDPINKFSDVQILYDFIIEHFEDLFNDKVTQNINPWEFDMDYLQDSDDEYKSHNITHNDIEFFDSDDGMCKNSGGIDYSEYFTSTRDKSPPPYEPINIATLYNNDKLPREEIHLYKKKPHINKIDKYINSCYKY
jgi:hypothetical protein